MTKTAPTAAATTWATNRVRFGPQAWNSAAVSATANAAAAAAMAAIIP